MSATSADPRKVFVVHGRNENARRAVFAFLRCLGLQPREWLQLQRSSKTPNAYIWNVVEAGLDECATAVVVLTGDDLAQVHPRLLEDRDDDHERKPTPQPRQNVLIELGAVWARGREKVVVIQLGPIRRITDIEGIAILHMNNTAAKREDFKERLKIAGAAVDSGTDYLHEGDFDNAVVSGT